ncbi:MAG: hypothetical protein A3H06_02495 [Candidatus Colwellbacteria bacterium RIFCSPLOWO2_12_FULL_44_13]|uniref:RCK N-terminal domain-containing protein n=3 Tax=Candidatus Colwelliibacteriota TaxID=1817904 RepID=A0A1G1Z737_9BACT|nr:MAG: hypothetical protein A3F24_03125 [Candidatus Colwellbacteria bacterium RIFCSPHIGHO2_12_FULL_44_17]OGY60249.1 MAG: hypothetical protein A3I31_00715 [Candidatus Colwellbacteria bacterium RIFCSPLOWO2_02_FULL_44_20b]OGY62057.1 MAG: hypothetical protein A3H06_02495 [Candidatus Colwellbacteria bacterium RIFCSPLOWO2_12_FULL_44_13]
MPIITEITLIVALAAFLSIIAHWLKQPTIIGYIAAGLLIGPLGFIELNNLEVVNSLAKIGIALLLFLVGLEINIKEIRSVGKAAVYTGLGQVIFTFLIGFGLAKILGFSLVVAAYIAIALTFSSTIIIIKLLSDKRELDTLYARIVVGLLLIQDLIAILALIILPGIVGDSQGNEGGVNWINLGMILIKGGALFGATLFIGKKVLPKLFDFISNSQETLFVASLAWGLGVAAIVASPLIGFSIEIGGFLAGLALASSGYHYQISARIKPLRDFFIILFFVILGSQMTIGGTTELIKPAIILSLFVLIGNPLIMLFIMGALGYRAHTSFKASITVAQISEFSLILAFLGLELGHLEESHVALITIVGLITIVVSSYLITHGDALYKILRKGLKIFEIRGKLIEKTGIVRGLKNHIVIIGADRMGSMIVETLKEKKANFVVIDFNPSVWERLKSERVPSIYGDANDEEIQEQAKLENARVIISTVPTLEDNLAILEYMKKNNPQSKVIMTAENSMRAKELYEEGADYVVIPQQMSGKYLAELVNDNGNITNLMKLRNHEK